MSKISEALEQLFQKQRIVLWYDEGAEMRDEFDRLDLPGVEKIVLAKNVFGVKYRILRQDRNSKFLLYSQTAQPVSLDNWLLDVQLANAVFSADKFSLWLAELELGPEYLDFVKAHEEFFSSAARRKTLKDRGIQGETRRQISLKMMAVSLGAAVEHTLEGILFALLADLSEGDSSGITKLDNFGLLPQLWRDLEQTYDYRAETAHIKDFALNLFDTAYLAALDKKHRLNQEAILLINRWKDSQKHQASFECLSNQFAEILNIPQAVQKYSITDLLALDYYVAIDYRILELLMDAVIKGTMLAEDCAEIVRRRSVTHWYKSYFGSMYAAVLAANNLLSRLKNLVFYVDSIQDGFRKYAGSWYQADQYYRKYIYWMRQSNQPGYFNELNEVIERQYSNNFLRPLNDNWQIVVDQSSQWHHNALTMQRDFFEQYVEPILRNNIKVAVVISDALRYELGEELADRIEREGRFSAEMDAMLGMLPSYTQLGMAALLPNQNLEILSDGSVAVDGISSMGSENRATILAAHFPGKSRVLLDGEIRSMTAEERRTLFRENQVVYVYHNQIDVVGDKMTEERIFEAAETALVELVSLIKMLRNANFTRIVVTADHGFLYQYQALDESDFASFEVDEQTYYARNRRFLAGKGLQATNGMRYFRSEELGLGGEAEVLIAKSINRLRVKVTGSRYVHGGASLQEIVIPVVIVAQERGEEADTRSVKIDKIDSTSKTITTGQVSVSFYQVEPVSAKVLPRRLRAGIFAEDGKLISDSHTLQFNFESENPSDREIGITFHLSAEADRYNRQRVFVRLEELIADTEHYRTYNEWIHQLEKAHFTFF